MPKKKVAQPVPPPAAPTAAPMIVEQPGQKLSQNQQKFNDLTQQISETQAEIGRVQAEVEKVRVRIAAEALPLLNQLHEQMREYVKALDQSYENIAWKKDQKKNLGRLISEEAYTVYNQLYDLGTDDPELMAIHDKYAEESLEEIGQQQDEAAKQAMKQLFGIDIDLEKAHNDPTYFDSAEAEFFGGAGNKNQKERKKSKKELEKEAQEQAEKALEAKDARSVYTTLAKALHPDLEPDEAEKIRKTEMMKRVTEAYNNQDFYQLLRLQLEYNLAHPDQMGNLVEHQLARYVNMLQKQLDQLTQAKHDLLYYGPDANLIRDFFTYKHDFSNHKYKTRLNRLKQELARAEYLTTEARDPEALAEKIKAFKKAYRQGGW
jgi:hypothetical protein